MSFQHYLATDRRLSILKLVARAPQGKLNEAVLETALKSLGHIIAYDEFLADLRLLEGKKLLTISQMEGLHIVHISRKGLDAADNLIKDLQL
ncbi:MAG: hypothetical protein K0U39_06265 [Alphaproteobacteria bacterium]|nr:hypothetical protein [Alphaproteobacteria bacterium]